MNAMTETKTGQSDILAALAKAMGQVQKIAKDSRNKHDGYNFASIDDFLALVNPICAENGLIVYMQEAEREDFERQGRNGASAWMRQSFDLTLFHVSGQSLPPVRRTVEVLRNGAQAYGSAQSYALKQFWRAILLIPTGDKDDADFAPTEAGTVSRQSHQQPRQRREEPSDRAVTEAKEYLAGASSMDELKQAFLNLPRAIAALPEVVAAKDARKEALAKTATVAADLAGDQIPY